MWSVLITILIIVIVCGVIAWLINLAPFIEATFKTIGVYAIIVVAVILILMQILPLVKSLG